MDTLIKDIRYSIRSLLRRPGFVAIAVNPGFTSHQVLTARMALGAQWRDILSLVLRKGMTLALLGIAIGLLAAFALAKWMSSLLFGVSARDPITFVAVAVLLLVALSACLPPLGALQRSIRL